MKAKLILFLYWKLFSLYLYLSKFEPTYHHKNRCYDSLGIIDTLGDDTDVTRFTWSYTEELGCIFAIKLPFGYSLQMIHYDGREIQIGITPKFNIE